VGPVAPDELRELSREGMRSYMRYWCDAFRLPGWDAARIDTFDELDYFRNGGILHFVLRSLAKEAA